MVSLSRDLGFGVVAKVEAENYSEAFKQLALIEDVYDRVPRNITWFRHRVREHEGNQYFELAGQTEDSKVRPTLSLGQYKKERAGFLFPKRKASEEKGGAWLENNGWVVWQKAQEETAKPENEKPASVSKRGKKPVVDEDTDF